MDEEKPKKKRRKAAADGEGSEQKEHKKNWREEYATAEEIKAYLSDHIYLRWNLVKYRLKAHNRTFETPCSEQEAISKHFRLPRGMEHGEFYTATDIQLVISEGPALRFPVEKIGSAMKVLGFAGYRSHGRRGYRVVPYSADEIEANRRLLASDAEPENETAGDSGDGAF